MMMRDSVLPNGWFLAPEENDDANADVFTQSDIDSARAEGIAEGKAKAKASIAEVAKAAAAAERERIKAILTCSESRGREDDARHLALETSIGADDARAVLRGGGGPSMSLEARRSGSTPLPIGMAAPPPSVAESWDRAMTAAAGKLIQ